MTEDPITAATALAETLACENAALRRLDVAAATALLDRKRAGTEALAAAQAAWQPGTRLPAARRARVQAVLARLEGVAAENKQLLERAIAVQGQVIGLLLRAVPAAQPVQRYGAGGGRAGRLQPVTLSSRV